MRALQPGAALPVEGQDVELVRNRKNGLHGTAPIGEPSTTLRWAMSGMSPVQNVSHVTGPYREGPGPPTP